MKRIVYLVIWFAIFHGISFGLELFDSAEAQPRYFRNRLHPDGNVPVTDSIGLPNAEEPFVFNVCTQVWDEKMPPFQKIDDIVKTFTEAHWFDSTLRLLDRIYPVGRFIMEDVGAVKTSTWLSLRSSIHDIMRELPLALHEDAHEYLDNHSREHFSYTYPIFPNFVLRIPYDHWPPRRIVEKYIPQEIKEENDYYKLYFTEQKQQLMDIQNLLVTLDEFNAYIHDALISHIVSDYADLTAPHCSVDLISFMYLIEMYLKALRIDFPSEYERFLKATATVEALLILWARADWAWKQTREAQNNRYCTELEKDKKRLADLVLLPENLSEIERLKISFCKNQP